MATDQDLPGEASPVGRYAHLLSLMVPLLVAFLIPMVVFSHGFLPDDDALRYAAKSQTGKSWHDIVVMPDNVIPDHNPGWNMVLRGVHLATGASPEGIVLLSVWSLAFLFLAVGLLFRRGGDWALALLILALWAPGFEFRLLSGRPLILVMAALVVVMGAWTQGSFNNKFRWGLATGLIAVCTWIQGGWYLWGIVVFSFALAGRFRHAAEFLGCLLGGALLGSLFTGAPVFFLINQLRLVLEVMGGGVDGAVKATEFRPNPNPIPIIIVVAVGVFLQLVVRRKNWREVFGDPVLMLCVLGWLGGLGMVRIWTDWGVPAFALWFAGLHVYQRQQESAAPPLRAVAVTLVASLALAISLGNNFNGRHSRNATYLSGSQLQGNELEAALPGSGGIVYTASMRTFYLMFYLFPGGDWKYALGYEPSLMTPENLSVYLSIQRQGYNPSTLAPWESIMRAEDRLVILQPQQPPFPHYEWHNIAGIIWSGRPRWVAVVESD